MLGVCAAADAATVCLFYYVRIYVFQQSNIYKKYIMCMAGY